MCPGEHGDPRNFEILKFIHFKTGAFEEIKLHHPEHLLQYVICSFSEQFVAFAFRCRERTPLRLKLPGGHHPHSAQLCVCIVIIMMSCVYALSSSWCHLHYRSSLWSWSLNSTFVYALSSSSVILIIVIILTSTIILIWLWSCSFEQIPHLRFQFAMPRLSRLSTSSLWGSWSTAQARNPE